MKLKRARVTNYRCIRDSGWVDFEEDKTIFVGLNESGKSTFLKALQLLNQPNGEGDISMDRDFPKGVDDYFDGEKFVQFDEIPDVSKIPVVKAEFSFEKDDMDIICNFFEEKINYSDKELKNNIIELYRHSLFVYYLYMEGNKKVEISQEKKICHNIKYKFNKKIKEFIDFIENKLCFMLKEYDSNESINVRFFNNINSKIKINKKKNDINTFKEKDILDLLFCRINSSLQEYLKLYQTKDDSFFKYEKIKNIPRIRSIAYNIEKILNIYLYHKMLCQKSLSLIPKFIYIHNNYRINNSMNLLNLKIDESENFIQKDNINYGNINWLKLMNITLRSIINNDIHLSNANYKNLILNISYENGRKFKFYLEKVSNDLSSLILKYWKEDQKQNAPCPNGIKIVFESTYLTIFIEDKDGKSVAFEERSDGFQYFFTFMVMYWAGITSEQTILTVEKSDKFTRKTDNVNNKAIVILDEPGMSLHASRQKSFKESLSEFAKDNQIIYTTHSAFMIGSDELDQVRVVSFSPEKGTKISDQRLFDDKSDNEALMPLQAALGYNLAQGVFMQEHILLVEGLIDVTYISQTLKLIEKFKGEYILPKLSILSCNGTGKVFDKLLFLRISHFPNIVCFLDSDKAGRDVKEKVKENNTIYQDNIFLVGDIINNNDTGYLEIEDLLNETLLKLFCEKYPQLEIMPDGLLKERKNNKDKSLIEYLLSKFKNNVNKPKKLDLKKELVNAYKKWAIDHSFDELSDCEKNGGKTL